MRRILVLGGGYAGLTAAARLGEARPDASITLIDAKPEFVERIRLHEIAAGSAPPALPYAPFLQQRNVGFHCARVTALDPERREVRQVRSDGATDSAGYDLLIYALGSQTDRAMVPGAAQHAAALDTVATAQAVLRGHRLLIAGGGLTAIEAAAEFAERHPQLQVTLIAGSTFGPNPGPGGLAPAGFAHIESVLQRHAIDVRRTRVNGLQEARAQLADGETLPFDACLWCAGFVASPIAAAAGIATDPIGAIRTDAALRSISHPDIIAIGDGADAHSAAAGKCRMSCATGRPMGVAAAQTALALLAGTPPPVLEFNYVFRCISLGRTDGLIQFVNDDDSPRQEIWTGARAARWKEYICRRTLFGIGIGPDIGPPPDEPPPRTR